VVSLSNDPVVSNVAAIGDVCRELGALVIKPFDWGGGGGVHVCRYVDGKFYCNGRPATIEGPDPFQLQRQLQKTSCLVTEFVHQAGYSRRIFPDSTNTIRILTMRDPETQRSFVATAVHRFGNSKSAPVDNWTAGGLSAKVDIETGTLSKAVTYPRASSLEWYQSHPETGERIEGVVIPGWQNVIARILAAADAYDFLSYVGWDVVIRDNGFSVLEGNNYTGVESIQVHGGLLKDKRVAQFYRYHRVI
jgi:hypothetical protein